MNVSAYKRQIYKIVISVYTYTKHIVVYFEKFIFSVNFVYIVYKYLKKEFKGVSYFIILKSFMEIISELKPETIAKEFPTALTELRNTCKKIENKIRFSTSLVSFIVPAALHTRCYTPINSSS